MSQPILVVDDSMVNRTVAETKLSDAGFEVILVNARYAKNVPDRKTDPVGCDSFIPTACYVAASDRQPKLRRCGHIYANENVW